MASGIDKTPVERGTTTPAPALDEALLERLHGDRHDRPHSTGRFTADDWLINQFVKVANRPRLLIAATVLDLVGAGLVYALIENRGPVEGMWWAVVTGFTVGYGDSYPESTAGRGVGAWLIISMFVLALCLGAQITSRLIEDKDEFTHREQEDIKASLRRMDQRQEALIAALANGRCASCRQHTSLDQSTVQIAPGRRGPWVRLRSRS